MPKLFEHLKKGLEDILAHKRGELNEKVLRKTIIEIPDKPKGQKITRKGLTTKASSKKAKPNAKHILLDEIRISKTLLTRLEHEALERDMSLNSVIIEKLSK